MIMTKFYSSKATAKRGAIRAIAKAEGFTEAELKSKIDELVTIVFDEIEEKWWWRRNQRARTEAEMEALKEQEANEKAQEVLKQEAELTEEQTGPNPFDEKPKSKRPRNGAVAKCHEIFCAEPTLRRKDAIQKCIDNGINKNTARTQYQIWYTAGGKEMK